MKTSRERVLDALNNKEGPVPVDFGGHRSSGIAAIAYAKLKKALGINTGAIYVYDVMGQLAFVEPQVRAALGVDTVDMAQAFLTNDNDWRDWALPDGTPCKVPAYLDLRSENGEHFIHNMLTGERRAIQVRGALHFERIGAPFSDYDLGEGIEPVLEKWACGSMEGAPPPGNHIAFTKENLTSFAQQANAFRQQTQSAILGVFGGSLFEITHWLFGMENDFFQMAVNPDTYESLIHHIGQIHLQGLANWLDVFGRCVDAVVFVDDYGGQQGPLISPEMYRRYFKPVHKRMWEMVHARSGAKVNLHSCGAIDDLLPDMIEIGLDAVNPVQITCTGMDAGHLKQKYAGRLTLWGGGCDTRDILPHASPARIREHVMCQCDILAPHGGFVFQQVHNIMANVPPENIIAMFEAVRDYNTGRSGA